MKKLLIVMLGVLMLLAASAFVACEGDESRNSHVHTGGVATCKEKAVCSDCGEEYGELDPENHASTELVYTTNGDGTHKTAHKCCNAVIGESEACTGGVATCEEKAKCEKCGGEYGEFGAHSYTQENKDSEYHWKECSVCGARDESNVTAHSVSTWENTATGKIGKCECGTTVTTIVENVPANEINLYTIANLGGNDYSIEETYSPVVTVNDEPLPINISSNDEDIAVYEDGKIKAGNAGKAVITVTYTLPGDLGKITKTFGVNVIRPIVTDETAVNYFSAIDGWHEYLTELFGEDAITEAKQTYNGEDYELTYADGRLSGMFTEINTPTVCSLTVCTDTYGYVLCNVTAYTKVIKDYTDFEDMRLTADRKAVKGYFILQNDIDLTNVDIDGSGSVDNYDTFYRYYDYSALAPTDMLTPTRVADTGITTEGDAPQAGVAGNAGFVGVFDGNGKSIIGFRAANSYGFFGTISGESLNNPTVIKNVSFRNVYTGGSGISSWTKGRVFAEYATCVSIENVHISFNVDSEWTKNFSLFGCPESVYFRFNKVIIEYNKTFSEAASDREAACVGFFATVGATSYYGKNSPNNEWHGQMKTVYQNLYMVAPAAANGRIMPLNQSTQLAVYAINDFNDGVLGTEATAISLDPDTLNPVANENGGMQIFHWVNALIVTTPWPIWRRLPRK